MPSSVMLCFLYFAVIHIPPLGAFNEVDGYCNRNSDECKTDNNERLILYSVNSAEGFNLQRDVYMRLAMMVAQARKRGRNLKLILPPWYRLHHWRSMDYYTAKRYAWKSFFNLDAFKTYVPVQDLIELFELEDKKSFELDRIYYLQNYPDAFESGNFVEKWSVNNDEDCNHFIHFWGYKNITVKETVCVRFQGRATKLLELLLLHPKDTKIMFAQAQIALHDEYGGKEYWKCRKSMKFSPHLIAAAEKFMNSHLKCHKSKCTNYVSIHWRRRDFAKSRSNDVPTILGTVKQIKSIISTYNLPTKIFIASDTDLDEMQNMIAQLHSKYSIYYFNPSDEDLVEYGDAGVAIIDQIICSRAAYFIGTYESTFTFRIQEEREILGFASNTTFNRLCPDIGKCEKMTQWKIQK